MLAAIKRHARYGYYVGRHKFFVGVQCARRGLLARALLHDLSKLLPGEWLPYASYFFPDGEPRQRRDSTGYYKPTDTGDAAFDFAWLLHQKRNDHHWQWWILPCDDGGEKVLEMSERARLEMVCDWWGASMAQGFGGWSGVVTWYHTNKGKMRFGPCTTRWIERFLEEVGR